MASKVFTLNKSGLIELMKSGGMQATLNTAGQSVANTASGMSGGSYGVRVHEATFVAIANVYPTSAKSARDNYNHNTLLKALNSTHI